MTERDQDKRTSVRDIISAERQRVNRNEDLRRQIQQEEGLREMRKVMNMNRAGLT